MLTNTSRHSQKKSWLQKLSVLLAALFVTTTLSTTAFAKGRIVWKETTVKENTKRESWRLEMEIHLNRAPDVAYVPMKFEFQPTAHYERALVDGRDGPVERTIPLSEQMALIESVDVGFLDAGTGVIQSRTKFSFKVTRAHDFQAGEYKVTIKDGRDGSTIGVPTTLKFVGENPVIDRRSIVFAGGEKKKKKKEEKAEEQAESSEEPDESAAEEDNYEEPEEGSVPPSVDERPGGGCHHSPSDSIPTSGLWLVALGGLAFLLRRRVLRQ